MWSDPIIKDGVIYVVDLRNGLYVLKYNGRFAREVRRIEFPRRQLEPGRRALLRARRQAAGALSVTHERNGARHDAAGAVDPWCPWPRIVPTIIYSIIAIVTTQKPPPRNCERADASGEAGRDEDDRRDALAQDGMGSPAFTASSNRAGSLAPSDPLHGRFHASRTNRGGCPCTARRPGDRRTGVGEHAALEGRADVPG